MGKLLLEGNLHKPDMRDEKACLLARAWTVMILETLGSKRKRSLMRFLYESHLIEGELPAIRLSRARFGGASLENSVLEGANLSGAWLVKADLSKTNLKRAILSGADLSGANLRAVLLSGADLSSADLSDAEGLTQEQVERAIGNDSTTLPRDIQRPEAWSE
jgi:uncharacterized protein YjbI with pentapeptide repeats